MHFTLQNQPKAATTDDKPFIDDKARKIGDIDMDRQAEEEKEKKRIDDRRKTQHGVIPSQSVYFHDN